MNYTEAIASEDVTILDTKSIFKTELIVFDKVQYAELKAFDIVALLDSYFQPLYMLMYTLRKLRDGTVYTHVFQDLVSLKEEVEKGNKIYIKNSSCSMFLSKIEKVKAYCDKYSSAYDKLYESNITSIVNNHD